MKKQTSSLPKQPAVASIANDRPFGQVFLIKKGGSITLEPAMPDTEEPLLAPLSEEEIRKLVTGNRAILFGEKTVGLNARIGENKFIWDAFLFDFSIPEDPRGYLLTVTKGITNGMLSMIAINSFLEAHEHRTSLINILSSQIRKDKTMLKLFKSFVVEGYEIDDMLEHVIRRYLHGLFVVNEDDADCVRLYRTYIEAKKSPLDIMFVSKYVVGKSKLLSVSPPFSEIRQKYELTPSAPKEKVIHTEDHHLSKSPVAASIYEKLKAAATKIDKSLVFNAKGKHYVSMKKGTGKNLAFFHFRKSGMYLVVMLQEKLVRKMVKKSKVKTLPPSVQSFWNGASTGLVIENTDNLKEIIEVLRMLIKQ